LTILLKGAKIMQRVAVLTGAGRGLGRAFEEALAERGYDVISVDKAWQISDLQNGAERITGDVCAESTLRQVDQAIASRGRVDLLINNAGLYAAGSLLDNSAECARLLFEVNVLAAIEITKRVYGVMISQRQGQIVAILSTGARRPKARESLYSATKAALAAFVESLSLEAAEHNVRVTAVYPGGMRTHFYDQVGIPARMDSFLLPMNVAVMVLDAIESVAPPREIVIVP
jgi:short-subunit dehydrogenase